MTISKDELRYYDEKAKGWTLTEGTYTFFVGRNSEDMMGKAAAEIK